MPHGLVKLLAIRLGFQEGYIFGLQYVGHYKNEKEWKMLLTVSHLYFIEQMPQDLHFTEFLIKGHIEFYVTIKK